ncbi:MAG: polyisoprenoid-binding protein [Chryseobacterium sp.]|nr:MAG: polyisoprenoid-binding protein [Chryseobacterium sp.]
MSNIKWVLDPTHSEIFFKVKHLMITNVKGTFGTFTASIDGEDFSKSPIAVTIEVNSITTNNADRDAHLKSGDFFEAEQYPEISFVSKSLDSKGDDEYKLSGDLTIKGITKPITLDVEFGGTNKDPWGNEKAGFEVKGKFNRSEFGLNWNSALETGGVLVSDEVKLEASVQFVKQTTEE